MKFSALLFASLAAAAKAPIFNALDARFYDYQPPGPGECTFPLLPKPEINF